MTAEEFLEVCRRNGLEIDDKSFRKLILYVSLLEKKNESINLISRKEKDIWSRHVLHCISPLFSIKLKSGSSVIDIGTGGGLPGIPWAILNPDKNFTLIDGTRKKIDAVKDFVKTLDLKNVSAVWGRAEELGRALEFREKFDYAVCRAVAELKKLVKWSFALLSKNSEKFLEKDNSKYYLHPGTLIAFKGGEIEKEISSAIKTNLVEGVEILDLNFDFADKKILLVKLKTKRKSNG